MLIAFALAGAIAIAPSDTFPPPAPPAGPRDVPVGVGAPPVTDDTTPARRRKAIEVSDAYATRLKIHYIASFATIPIFAAQAVVGEQLFHNEQNGYPPSPSLKTAHDAIAVTLGALFVTNTVTGSMNWWETRHNEKGRTWRTVHAALMLLADAGFAYTASLGERAGFEKGGGNASRDVHAQWAETSAGVALVSYIMMWKPIRGDK
jgi:hypothetical protein